MTLFRNRLIPFVLATALFALGGCGLFFEEGPTEATLATMNGLQAITEAIATAVLPEDLGGTTLPYSADATGSGNPDEGEFAAFGRALVQALGGTSQPLLSLDFLGDTATPCAPGGTVTLTGSADVTDARDPGTGRGDITIAFNGMQAVANLCEGYGHRSTGILTASANDLISISDAGVPDHDHWHVSRSELATGSLTVTKVSSGATYNVTVYWSRQGTLDLDVERPTSALTLLGQSQTVYLTVNGQSCTGHYTGRLISPYDWDCS